MNKDSGQGEIHQILQPLRLLPVGFVRNNRQNTNRENGFQSLPWQEKINSMEAQSRQLSEIVINPDLVEALEGIEEFSHIMVIFWAHRTLEGIEKTLKVHPLGSDDFPLVGVFATRSPARPNNILVTAAKLLAREGNILRVTGLDALDGSPVLDIKPYYAERNIKEIHVPAWMQTIDAQYDRHQP